MKPCATCGKAIEVHWSDDDSPEECDECALKSWKGELFKARFWDDSLPDPDKDLIRYWVR